MTGRRAVYRAYDAQGALLYVGSSEAPDSRIQAHRYVSAWAKDAADVRVKWHGSHEAALNAEAFAIFTEKPKHNTMVATRRIADMLRVRVRREVKRKPMEHKAPSLIKQWLAAEERSAAWLAGKIPSSRAAVSLWLTEKQIPKRTMRQRLQDVTGLPVADERAWI